MTHPLVGMWKLVSFERAGEDGAVTRADSPTGFLIYTAEGWMSEAFEFRPLDDPAAPVTHVLYCGTYETDGDVVTHIPSVHVNPDLVGARLDRGWSVEGNRFTLRAGSATLVWERVR